MYLHCLIKLSRPRKPQCVNYHSCLDLGLDLDLDSTLIQVGHIGPLTLIMLYGVFTLSDKAKPSKKAAVRNFSFVSTYSEFTANTIVSHTVLHSILQPGSGGDVTSVQCTLLPNNRRPFVDDKAWMNKDNLFGSYQFVKIVLCGIGNTVWT